MLSSVDVERKVLPIIMQCLDGIENAANSINEKEVSVTKSKMHRADAAASHPMHHFKS